MKLTVHLPKIISLVLIWVGYVVSSVGQTGLEITEENIQHNNEFYISEYVHIQEGAGVYVLGDVVVASNAAQLENEGTLQVQGNFILAPGAILKSFNGRLVMKNNYANQNSPQFLEGDFTGFNAIPNLMISSNNSDGVVYLKNGNLEIINKLRLQNGRLRTGPVGHDSGADYPYKVSILNDNKNAISGYSFGNSTSKYIEGKLEREVGLGPYFFPVGPQPSEGEGIEPFAMNFLAAPPSSITGYYDNGTSTPIGSTVNCIFEQDDPVGDDGSDGGQNGEGSQSNFLPNQYEIDCVAGQWIVDGNSLVFFYDIQFFPSQRVLGECNFGSYFMAKNGVIENICPVNEFILYEQKVLGAFDIAGWAGSGYTDGEDPVYLETLQDEIPVTVLDMKDIEAEKDLVGEDVQGGSIINLKIFPNPVSIEDGHVNFLFEKSQALTIRLYDNVGVLIASKVINSAPGINKVKLLPKSISAGIYNVVVQDESNTHRARLAVVH